MEIAKIKEAVEEFLSGRELFLVDAKCSPANEIEVVIDSMGGVPLDTCIELNRFLESKFDRDAEDYELTVSSASISEPFVLVQQYRKNLGREVEVWIRGEALGEKQDVKREGVLTAADDETFTVVYRTKVAVEGKKKKEEREFTDTIRYADARSTRLIIKF